MFGSFLYGLKRALRKTGYSIGAGIFMSIGLAFLTVAAWIYLSQVQDSLFAALIIGCVYFGLGLVLLALASIDRPMAAPHPAHTEVPPASSPAGLVGALMQGVGAGMAAGAASRPQDRRR